jgi:outer membrane protein
VAYVLQKQRLLLKQIGVSARFHGLGFTQRGGDFAQILCAEKGFFKMKHWRARISATFLGRGNKTMKRSLWRAALVMWMAGSLIVSPFYAQAAQQQNQSPVQTQSPSRPAVTFPANVPEVQPAQPAAQEPISVKHLSLGPNYSHGRPLFPDLFAPYAKKTIEQPSLTNTPKIQQLIHDGKLMLSLDDAIALALENNLDIRVQRYLPWIVETQVLVAEAGQIPQPASSQQVVLGLPPAVSFDPQLTAQVNWAREAIPVNNIFTSGFAAAAPEFIYYSANYNFGYTQGFHTGTAVSLQWQNDRTSTNSPGYIFNPAVQSTLTFTISQPLLNGCCRLPNTRFIIEAKNSTKISLAQFDQAVMADIATTADDYWELVYDRGAVKVEEQAVAASQKLYEDNKKELEIGTVAPLDVITAESQLANDQQQLVAARTNQLLQQAKLLNDITKNPLDASLVDVEIVPTTPVFTPQTVENVPVTDLMNEAWQKRPEMTVDRLTIVNDKIEVRVTRNSLLPSLSIFGYYQGTGIAGINTTAINAPSGAVASPQPEASWLAPQVLPSLPSPGPNLAPQVFPAIPIAYATSVTGAKQTGLSTALNNMINASSPTYEGGINLSMPIRNRSAQANNARAQLSERQEEVLYKEQQNTIFVNVRQAQIALEQDRAQVAAAAEATKLAQQTYEGEEKKYQLGTSNSYTVVLRQRDLTLAESTELRARINLIEAEVAFNQAMGRTLEANNITVADAVRGNVYRTPNIPGALDADDPTPAPHDPWAPGKK